MKADWRLLTEGQKQKLRELKILNGTGPLLLAIIVNWLFYFIGFDIKEFSERHDFDYYVGHTEEDRKLADIQFYKRLKDKALKSKNFIIRYIYLRLAWFCFYLVDTYGGATVNGIGVFFNYDTHYISHIQISKLTDT